MLVVGVTCRIMPSFPTFTLAVHYGFLAEKKRKQKKQRKRMPGHRIRVGIGVCFFFFFLRPCLHSFTWKQSAPANRAAARLGQLKDSPPLHATHLSGIVSGLSF